MGEVENGSGRLGEKHSEEERSVARHALRSVSTENLDSSHDGSQPSRPNLIQRQVLSTCIAVSLRVVRLPSDRTWGGGDGGHGRENVVCLPLDNHNIIGEMNCRSRRSLVGRSVANSIFVDRQATNTNTEDGCEDQH